MSGAILRRRDRTARSLRVVHYSSAVNSPILKENISEEATVYTDEADWCRNLGREFADHGFVHHSAGEWGRGPVHTNTIEG